MRDLAGATGELFDRAYATSPSTTDIQLKRKDGAVLATRGMKSGVAAPLDPRAVAHPFLGIREVAYFLGTTINRVRVMHRRGDLGEAMLADGQPFRPTGVLLFRAADVIRAVPEDRQGEFLEWQRGLRALDFGSVPRSHRG